jgi:universal stress protein E
MKPLRKILVVVDSTQELSSELERAMKLADQSPTQLHLLDVMKDVNLSVRLLSRDYTHIHALLVNERQEALQRLVDTCRAHGIEAVAEVREGVSSQITVDVAREIQADLIIRAAKGARSLEVGPLGNSAKRLLRVLPCPLWLVQAAHEPPAQPQLKTIVASVDATPDDEAHERLNRRILEVACDLSRRERSRLVVCHMWNLYGADMLKHRMPQHEFDKLVELNRTQHAESFERLLSQFDLHASGPSARLIEGEPSQAIPAFCKEQEADLLICGTVARHGIRGLLLGNTAERIVNRIDCSILALTPQA